VRTWSCPHFEPPGPVPDAPPRTQVSACSATRAGRASRLSATSRRPTSSGRPRRCAHFALTGSAWRRSAAYRALALRQRYTLGSTRTFVAFMRCMLERDLVAIALCMFRARSTPVICALVPQVRARCSARLVLLVLTIRLSPCCRRRPSSPPATRMARRTSRRGSTSSRSPSSTTCASTRRRFKTAARSSVSRGLSLGWPSPSLPF
jgi:hypothetical protein